MKSLFEIVTTSTGESYVRSYAWAHCEEDALAMFNARFAQRWEIREVVKLFSADSNEFCTVPSDCGDFEFYGAVWIPEFKTPVAFDMNTLTHTPAPVPLDPPQQP